MKNNNEILETLNDLVKINNDRIVGCEKAADEIKSSDAELYAVFMEMADQSRLNSEELQDEIISLGGKFQTDTTVAGKIYRAWMTVKNTITGANRESILESCEFGENAAQKAYKEVLEGNVDIDTDLQEIIIEQKALLRVSRDHIKSLRKMHHA